MTEPTEPTGLRESPQPVASEVMTVTAEMRRAQSPRTSAEIADVVGVGVEWPPQPELSGLTTLTFSESLTVEQVQAARDWMSSRDAEDLAARVAVRDAFAVAATPDPDVAAELAALRGLVFALTELLLGPMSKPVDETEGDPDADPTEEPPSDMDGGANDTTTDGGA